MRTTIIMLIADFAFSKIPTRIELFSEGGLKQTAMYAAKGVLMAIYHFKASIISGKKGKSAIASAAYQSASTLVDEKLGLTFSYTNKEEVIHSEILLPEHCPKEYADRQILWNEVEKVNSRVNSQYARQFVVALPNTWTEQECVDKVREFCQKTFVDAGMCADFSIHYKPGNIHAHIMTTLRGFNPDGSWQVMEKKAFALDEKGNRIPVIDPETGLQKVRKRPGKGEEKVWKKVTVQSNDWNKRSTLLQWRKDWADYCNQFLSNDEKIDHRSYEERGIDKVPGIHYAPGMKEMEQRGGFSWQMQENREIERINKFFDKARRFIEDAKMQLVALRDLILRRRVNGESRGVGTEANYRRVDVVDRRIPNDNAGTAHGTASLSDRVGVTEGVQTESGASHTKVGRHKH